MEKKTYVFVAGKHHVDGIVYKKGDRIELTDKEAEGLANKIINPEAAYGINVDTIDEVATLKERIAALELENEQLKEAIDGDE